LKKGGKKGAKQKENPQNRSTSFQTVKKLNLSKMNKKTPCGSQINSSRSNLNSTIKKRPASLNRSGKKNAKNVLLDDRSDFPSKLRSLSTPKFG